MHIFFTPDISKTNELAFDEVQHCYRVLRLKTGDKIRLCDGLGNLYTAVLTQSDAKHCIVEILETQKVELPWASHIEVALAPTKNMDRMEWFAEKATEIGINKISFLNCRYSERKEIKTARIEKILVAAMKQSQKATLPKLQDLSDFRHFVQSHPAKQKFIAHCYSQEKKLLSQVYNPDLDTVVLIGPEGDFSEDEINMALTNGFQAVSLGHSRLRTETAALVACHTMQTINELKTSL